MKGRVFGGTIAAVILGLGAFASAGNSERGRNDFEARLIGGEETELSISTTGHGRLTLHINTVTDTIEYELSYDDLEGVAPAVPGGTVLFAHIHFGQRRRTGGVSAFLCGGGSKGACPTPSGTVQGTIVAADVIGPTAQGIEPLSFDELVRAIRTGYAYANVHTTRWPSGEIRGQIRNDDRDDHKGHDDHDGHGDHDHHGDH
jgi:hypothetical protein